MLNKSIIAASITAALLSGAANAAVEVNWWHAMGGTNTERVNKIAADFNALQSDFTINAVYKGNYTETMTAAIAAFRAKKQPHIVQVFEVGTATMMAAKGAVYPVEQVMNDSGVTLNKSDYLPAVISYYQTPEGELLSMPFNSSTPVLWYNQDALAKAGVTDAPKTWDEVSSVSKKLVDSGMKCGIAVGWQSWGLIENYSAWNNIELGTKQNGYAGLDTELTFNNKHVTANLQRLADMQKDGSFTYGGRRGESLAMFTNGDCGMWINSSAYYGSIKGQAKFKFAQAMMPYDSTVASGPQNSIIGGATLWTLRGHDKEDYKGVAEFMKYLSSAEVQAWWHQQTGYVPITTSAYKLSQEQGFYQENPGTDTAIKQLSLNTPTANSRGIRFGNFVQIRDIINAEMEMIWNGSKSAETAMNDAVSQGNKLLRKFEKANK
ncbi:MAG: sn-glycerol-3-phosphate ABC transporter substrate-binding protein UgpB [Pseudomonadales bacterium]|nr:sn-glycerol-3-phosphate ABC transporter substrate-binding protein UgpB [Pseudomonadales bacterium]NRA13983.1 sn-glycerol-3-phosphate ABC transporter substrate-binding protein UgpB [Oceanospirillaceae bacterium]